MSAIDELPVEERLGLEWELWVVEQLIAGAIAPRVIEALVAQGLPLEYAQRAVETIASSPSFLRMQRATSIAKMAEQIVRARVATVTAPTIDRRTTVDRETFRREYWDRSRPVLLTEIAREMRAVQRWTRASLAERFGDATVSVNVGRASATRPSETERYETAYRFGDYLDEIGRARSNELYIVSRNGLLDNPALASMWDDLAPLPDILVPPSPPRGASLWIGPGGTKSPAHFDPHHVLLVQIEGRKRVRIAPPDRLALFDSLDGYYVSQPFEQGVLEVEIGPGDALYVPLAWFHEITALEPSITLSMLCFPWPNDFHWIKPYPRVDDDEH